MCKALESLIFCSCEPEELPQKLKAAGLEDALSSAPGENFCYCWELRRKPETRTLSGPMTIGRIIMPQKQLSDTFNEEIVLSALNNNANYFDFPYAPQSGDCLRISTIKDYAYMSFIFSDEGLWKSGIPGMNSNEVLHEGSLLNRE
jgi:hypothetical protein